jgi:low temperature requirement protein LtrA
MADAQPERHASWIELFFDLVVVAGVGRSTRLLSHGPSFADVGPYLLGAGVIRVRGRAAATTA